MGTSLAPFAVLIPALLAAVSGQKLTCNGEIRFMVLQNFTRNDREYFYHTTAASVNDCVAKCYANEFCFSAGFQPTGGSTNPCLFSYRSAYGCSYRTLVASHPDDTKEVIAECIKCSGVEGTGGSLPTESASTVVSHSTATTSSSPVITNASSVAAETTAAQSSPAITTAAETSTAAVTTAATTAAATEATTNATEAAKTTESSKQLRQPCQNDEEIHFQLGHPGNKDLPFFGHESVDNSAECAHKCFLQPDCESAGFLPGIYRGTDVPGKATCIFAGSTVNDTCGAADSAVSHFNDTQGPAVFHCFTCAKSKGTEGNATAVTGGTNIESTPITATSEAVSTPNGTTEGTTQLPNTTVAETTAANVTGEPKIDVSPSSLPAETTVESTTPSNATHLCSVPISFEVKPTDGSKSFNFDSSEAVQSASDCAFLCYSKPDCHQAGFVPTNSQSGSTPQCLFSSDNSSTCDSSKKVTVYVASDPVMLTCISCPSESGVENVTGQSKVDQTAETKPVESSTVAVSTSVPTGVCSKGLKFKVTSSDPGKNAQFGNNTAVDSAAACAALCYSRPDCKIAGFMPAKTGTGNPDECVFSSGYEPICSREASELVSEYTKLTPVFLECFVCGETSAQPPVGTSRLPEGPATTEAIPVKPTGTVAPSPGLYEPCEGDIRFHTRVVPLPSPSIITEETPVTSAASCAKLCYSKPNCPQSIFVPGNVEKNETSVCKLTSSSKPSCSGDVGLVAEYNDTAEVALECFVCVPYKVPTGAPKIDVSPSTQIVPVSTTNVPSGVTGRPECSASVQFTVKIEDSSKSSNFVENLEVGSAQECAKLCYSRANCSVAGFIPANDGQSKAECLFSVGVTPNCSDSVEKLSVYNGSKIVTLNCLSCGSAGEPVATTVAGPSGNETGTTLNATSTSGTVVEPDHHQFVMRVEKHGPEPLVWAPLYVVPANRANIYDLFKKGVSTALNSTSLAANVVGVDVLGLEKPQDYNGNWTTGLIFRFNVSTLPPGSVDDKTIWDQLVASVHSTNDTLGGTELLVAFPQPDQSWETVVATTAVTTTAGTASTAELANSTVVITTEGPKISHNLDRVKCKENDIQFQQLASINVKNLDVLTSISTDTSQACATRCYENPECELAGYFPKESTAQNCLLAKNLTVCLPTQFDQEKERLFKGSLLLYINCAGSDVVLGGNVTPAISFSIDRRPCNDLVQYRTVEATSLSKSFSYSDHIPVATAQDCAQLCYQNSTCLSAGFIPSNGAESAVCLPISQGSPLCDPKLKAAEGLAGPVILDCLACPGKIAGNIDATPSSRPVVSTEIVSTVATTTSIPTNQSVAENTTASNTSAASSTAAETTISAEINATTTVSVEQNVTTTGPSLVNVTAATTVSNQTEGNATTTPVASTASVELNTTAAGLTEATIAPLANTTVATEVNFTTVATEVNFTTVAITSTESSLNATEITLTTPELAFSLNRPACESSVVFRVTVASGLSKSLSFADSQKVETVQDCAQICYQTSKCSSAGFIPPAADQPAVCILAKQPESSECGGLLERVNNTQSDKLVVIDCITCASGIIEASPATKAVEGSTVSPAGNLTETTVSTANTTVSSLETSSPVATTNASTTVEVPLSTTNQTEGNSTVSPVVSTAAAELNTTVAGLTEATSTLLPNTTLAGEVNVTTTAIPQSTTVTGESGLVNGSIPQSSSLSKAPCNNSLVAFQVEDAINNDKSKEDFTDVQFTKSVQDCAKLCYASPNCTQAGFIPHTEQADSQCLLSSAKSAHDCNGRKPSITVFDTSKPIMLDCLVCVGNNIDVFPVTKGSVESSSVASVVSGNETTAETTTVVISTSTEFFLAGSVTTTAAAENNISAVAATVGTTVGGTNESLSTPTTFNTTLVPSENGTVATTSAANETTTLLPVGGTNETLTTLTTFNTTLIATENATVASTPASNETTTVLPTAIPVANVTGNESASTVVATTTVPSVGGLCEGVPIGFRLRSTTLDAKNAHFVNNPEYLLTETLSANLQACARLCFLNANCTKAWVSPQSPSSDVVVCTLEHSSLSLSAGASECESSLVRVTTANNTESSIIDCMTCGVNANIDAFPVTKTPSGVGNFSELPPLENATATVASVNVTAVSQENKTVEGTTTVASTTLTANETISSQPTLGPFTPSGSNETATTNVTTASVNETSVSVTPGSFVPSPSDFNVSTSSANETSANISSVPSPTTAVVSVIPVSGAGGTRTCDGQTVFQTAPVSGSFSGSQSLGVYSTSNVAICASTCYSVSDCNSAKFSPGLSPESSQCTLLRESLPCSPGELSTNTSRFPTTETLNIHCIQCKESAIESTPETRPSFTKGNESIGSAGAENATSQNATSPSPLSVSTVASTAGESPLNVTPSSFSPSGSEGPLINPANFRVCAPGGLSFHLEPTVDAPVEGVAKLYQTSQATPEICASICYAVSNCTLAVFDPVKGASGVGQDGLCTLYHNDTADCSNATLVSNSIYGSRNVVPLKITCATCSAGGPTSAGPEFLSTGNPLGVTSLSTSGNQSDLNFVTSTPPQNATELSTGGPNGTSLVPPELSSINTTSASPGVTTAVVTNFTGSTGELNATGLNASVSASIDSFDSTKVISTTPGLPGLLEVTATNQTEQITNVTAGGLVQTSLGPQELTTVTSIPGSEVNATGGLNATGTTVSSINLETVGNTTAATTSALEVTTNLTITNETSLIAGGTATLSSVQSTAAVPSGFTSAAGDNLTESVANATSAVPLGVTVSSLVQTTAEGITSISPTNQSDLAVNNTSAAFGAVDAFGQSSAVPISIATTSVAPDTLAVTNSTGLGQTTAQPEGVTTVAGEIAVTNRTSFTDGLVTSSAQTIGQPDGFTAAPGAEGTTTGSECKGKVTFQIETADSNKSETFYENRESLTVAECARLCVSSRECRKAGWLGVESGQSRGTCLLSSDAAVCREGWPVVNDYLQGNPAAALSLDCIKCESSSIPSR